MLSQNRKAPDVTDPARKQTQLKRTPELIRKVKEILERNKRLPINKSQSFTKIAKELNLNGTQVCPLTIYKLLKNNLK